MHILCVYTDQKLAQQGQTNSKSVLSALPTFRISGYGVNNKKTNTKTNTNTHLENTPKELFVT